MEELELFLREWNSESDYIKAHTSGSTGNPKEIHLLKSDMISSAMATNAFFGINSSSTLTLPLSLDYIAGKMMAVRAICASCRLEIIPPSNSFPINNHSDLISIVPTQIDNLLSQKDSYKKLKNILVGGAPMSSLQETRLASFSDTAWLGFGMTETCSHVALRRVGDDGIFHAMEGIEFDIDPDSCLIIKSHRFSWQQLTTNDVVDLLSPNAFCWVGRRDNTINSGGLKLHPEKIEKIILEVFPNLSPFYLRGEPDANLGQRLVMVAENPPERLMEQLREKISDHRILPKAILSVDKLPRTANGKILRDKG